MEQMKIEKMRQFYDLFPYPNRPFFLAPKIEAHMASHGGFAQLLALGRTTFAEKVWHFSSRLRMGKLSVQSHEWFMIKGEIEAVFPRTQRLLLVGCGTDEPLLFRKLHPNNEIVAVDLSRKAIQKAKKKIFFQNFIQFFKFSDCLKRIQFLLGNAEMVLKEKALGGFDFIQCFGVLHHQPEPAHLLAAMVERLNPGGVLRLMVYSFHGRKLERRIQSRYERLWNGFLSKRKFKVKILFHFLRLRVWQLMNFFGFKSSTAKRFQYLGVASASVADALMHPSDPGVSLQYFHEQATLLGLELVYCEGKIENVGKVLGFQEPQNTWNQILAADIKQELLTNPILIYRKAYNFESR